MKFELPPRRAGKYPTQVSMSQRFDTATGRFVESLECGHVVPTPLSAWKPYRQGVRRVCKECYRAEGKSKAAPRPVCDTSALEAAVSKLRFANGESPCVQVFPIAVELSGVYCLMRDGKVKYIGQSQNVLARVGSHATFES
jgi:hypothetical protein